MVGCIVVVEGVLSRKKACVLLPSRNCRKASLTGTRECTHVCVHDEGEP